MEKKRYLKISRPNLGGFYVTGDQHLAKDELITSFENDEIGEKLLFELVEMTEDEFNALPEFEGW